MDKRPWAAKKQKSKKGKAKRSGRPRTVFALEQAAGTTPRAEKKIRTEDAELGENPETCWP